MSANDAISQYAEAQSPEHAAICRVLCQQITAALPQAEPKVWHAMPVWFIGEIPVVGYKATSKHVNLLFWNGQAFQDAALKPVGKYQAAQIQFSDETEIDAKLLRRWLEKAGTALWDIAVVRERRRSRKGNGD